jgi:hypothetical protein
MKVMRTLQAVFNGEDASGKFGLWVTDGIYDGISELAVTRAILAGFSS